MVTRPLSREEAPWFKGQGFYVLCLDWNFPGKRLYLVYERDDVLWISRSAYQNGCAITSSVLSAVGPFSEERIAEILSEAKK